MSELMLFSITKQLLFNNLNVVKCNYLPSAQAMLKAGIVINLHKMLYNRYIKRKAK